MNNSTSHPPPGTWNARNLLTVHEVAEWARVHPKTVYRWIKEGKLEAIQFGPRTFDLQISSTAFTQCTCPIHGTEQCDCQLVVLLVYRDKLPPTSLVAHGHDGKTWFALVDSPEQRAAPRSIAAIQQALVPPGDFQNLKDQQLI